MLQVVIITTDKQFAHLQDEINSWLKRASEKNIKIVNIFMTGGTCTIFYEILSKEN
jgi:hypothetical protein